LRSLMNKGYIEFATNNKNRIQEATSSEAQ